MRIRKMGVLNDKHELILGGQGSGTVAAILTNANYFQVETTPLHLAIIIGTGLAQRQVTLDIPVPTEILTTQLSIPVSLRPDEVFELESDEYVGAFIFRNQIFLASADYLDDNAKEEAELLIKKQVYSDDNRLKRLRQEVDAMERVIGYTQRQGRTAIPEAVKLLVWTRDEGQCIRCGSKENLHFDHIIPVSKGGGNTEDNIQILCEYCNLQKSDKIAF
jgi:hypothetical protein